MLHSAILSTFIKLPFVIKIFVLSIFRGRFTQVLLYRYKLEIKFQQTSDGIDVSILAASDVSTFTV